MSPVYKSGPDQNINITDSYLTRDHACIFAYATRPEAYAPSSPRRIINTANVVSIVIETYDSVLTFQG